MSTMEEWEDWEADDDEVSASTADDVVAAPSSPPLASSLASAGAQDAFAAVKTVHSDSDSAQPAGFTPDPAHASTDEDDSDTTDSDSDSWTWSFARMEKDVRRLEARPLRQVHVLTSDSSSNADDNTSFEHIMQVAEQVATDIRTGQARVVALEALALVTKLHLLLVREGFGVEQHAGDALDQVPAIVARLEAIAPDWTVRICLLTST